MSPRLEASGREQKRECPVLRCTNHEWPDECTAFQAMRRAIGVRQHSAVLAPALRLLSHRHLRTPFGFHLSPAQFPGGQPILLPRARMRRAFVKRLVVPEPIYPPTQVYLGSS